MHLFFLFSCSGSQIDIYSLYHLQSSCWTLRLINVEINVALGAAVYRKKAKRSKKLGEIRSCTGRNFSRARATTEVKCLPPNSLDIHSRFQNRKNHIDWINIGRDMTRNRECISMASHIEMF